MDHYYKIIQETEMFKRNHNYKIKEKNQLLTVIKFKFN
jgi:hypothetical protein